MKNGVPMQLIVAVGVVVIGGGFLAAEYFLVKWYPRYQQQVNEQTLKLLPYRNDALGIQVQVAAGIYGRVESFPGGVRIFRPRLLGDGPSLTITSQPNPDRAPAFSPQVLAVWQTARGQEGIPRYGLQHTAALNRRAVPH